MGVPTSEVGYTSPIIGRGDHEVHKGHGNKEYYSPTINKIIYLNSAFFSVIKIMFLSLVPMHYV
jgi:hypothetical protein